MLPLGAATDGPAWMGLIPMIGGLGPDHSHAATDGPAWMGLLPMMGQTIVGEDRQSSATWGPYQ